MNLRKFSSNCLLQSLLLSFLLTSLQVSYSLTIQDDNYHYTVDINKLKDDQLMIELIPPNQSKDVVYFRLPAVVPGSYALHNFGKFVTKVWAYDKQGNMLSMQKMDGTSWMITGASNLAKIEYRIDDTFDDKSLSNKVFEPSGTSFEENAVFLINTYCVFGYIDGQIDRNFDLTVIKPPSFHGSTCLNAVTRESDRDVFLAADYKDLMDNPILYCVPDTTSIEYEDASITVSVYSKTKRVSSSSIAGYLKDVLSSHRKLMAGKLPLNKYAFLFYIYDPESYIPAYGAHEHLKSSVYFMPDAKSSKSQDISDFASEVRELGAHEFFHLITPLTLHSEELSEFNINKRSQMSRHLWLYEGVTEYMAHYSLLQNEFITPDDFRKTFQRKMNNSEFYDKTVSFTDMSLNVHDKYQSEFTNVYQKGAVIGLCLDLLIRKETGGKTGLADVLLTLMQKYSAAQPFSDEVLFSEIEALTSPKVGEMLRNCVAGTADLPFKELMPLAGFKYSKIDYRRVSFGNSIIDINESTYFPYFVTVDETNKLCKSLGLLPDDELVGINGRWLYFVDYSEVFGSPEDKVKDGDDIEFYVARKDATGNYYYVKLEGKIGGTIKTTKHKLAKNETIAEPDAKIYHTWLGR